MGPGWFDAPRWAWAELSLELRSMGSITTMNVWAILNNV